MAKHRFAEQPTFYYGIERPPPVVRFDKSRKVFLRMASNDRLQYWTEAIGARDFKVL